MLEKIIQFSLKNKLIIILFIATVIGFGILSLTKIPIGAVPDITNNQVQVITTTRNLSTQDVEQFITYPIELEMANLPGVEEIRSVSKFGLSVVTIVFNDNMGTYLPRQLIAEKIKSATENIPEGFGTPSMGPITTGLGEIYQYILDVKPGYEDKYTTAELRTIQDWIVKRQLSGIPGVVEVNTWGGYLKQYEVSGNPQKLLSMNITMSEVLDALEKNNSVAGGGYIEKNSEAYFIRGEGLVTSLEDIENIVVKNVKGVPIYVRDIAKVGYGSATRFGAITGNGQGEKVLGQIMMLKDGNSKEIIDAVKERVASIQKTLPEGVFINGFLERSELIGKTTFTVAENLILGSLIVIFIVVLLLGNLRSGLVVASVIPLSLLFALTCMYIFGIDANLMSLGAIDFGIIIDGAVIIVEFIAFQITSQADKIKLLSKAEQQDKIDTITFNSASKMMNSAVFGQLIILLVFIPILSLSGVEGKMFKPMALTFSFALIGAMIFCLTYVPVASSLFLKPSKQSSKNISVRLVNALTKSYKPVIHWALLNKKIIFGISGLLLVSSAWLFTKMGGEFVPTLDEGDFVIQPILKTGTSLTKTIETTTKIEKILLEFPEVDQVVTRIGAAEVPTDPMSMEECDIIIKLHPKKEWTSAETKDDLAEAFKEALSVIPGMEVEFTQPIEMRFNELITGVRADVAIKVFGENLSVLASKANEIRDLIKNVEGASDISIEKVEGLPQMSVKYNRSKIARYGLNIADLNKIVSMGFGGKKVGSVFEGEKRFDMVMRLNAENRQSIENLRNLYIDTPNGSKVPLSELAEISYTKGPAKISRDDTKRRIVVGINVRNRDLQSVVDDVSALIDQHLKLPPGYSITYGGQFENLQKATSRLKIAVPIALALIFIMLHFAFQSVKEAFMVFTAIPLSAVGGILLLWLRGLPFSISAGVGFIALFGIAVLNGIVLIEHFKELKAHGITNIEERIKRGTTERLRPVLLTAGAAALGFLPMAVSTNAGAEVQRPLATVVIGGLVTATALTLIVLPVLYAWFEEQKDKKLNKKGIITSIIILIGISNIQAQQKPVTIDEAINLAIENNAGIKASALQVNESKAMINSAFNFDKTSVYYSYDENNLAIDGKPLKVFGVAQNFKFPTVYFADKKVNKAQYNKQQSVHNMQLLKLKKDVSIAYYGLLYAENKAKSYQTLDSLYQNFAHAAKRRFELGESNYLEMITAQSKQSMLQAQYKQAVKEITIYQEALNKVVQVDSISVVEQPLVILEINNVLQSSNPSLQYLEDNKLYYKALYQQEKQTLLPDLTAEYFQGTNSGLSGNLIGYQFGVKIPILFSGNASKIKSKKLAYQAVEEQQNDFKIQYTTAYNTLLARLDQLNEAIVYYENTGKNLSEQIINTAEKSYKQGEIDFFQYIQSIENAKEIELNYLDSLNQYNQTIIEINYLTL